MNDRYRNVCKAHDHIIKCRTKEAKTVFIPYWGYVVTPSEELLKARIRKMPIQAKQSKQSIRPMGEELL